MYACLYSQNFIIYNKNSVFALNANFLIGPSEENEEKKESAKTANARYTKSQARQRFKKGKM